MKSWCYNKQKRVHCLGDRERNEVKKSHWKVLLLRTDGFLLVKQKNEIYGENMPY